MHEIRKEIVKRQNVSREKVSSAYTRDVRTIVNIICVYIILLRFVLLLIYVYIINICTYIIIILLGFVYYCL